MSDNRELFSAKEGIEEFEKELAKVFDLDCSEESPEKAQADNQQDWRIKPEESLHILVDIQERLVPIIPDRELVEKNALIVVKACQALDIPLLVTEQYPQGLGKTLPALKEATDAAGATYFSKTRFTAALPEVMETIEQSGRQSIILSGIEAHICVYQTAMDLLARGYRVYLAEDAIGSRNPAHKSRALQNLTGYGAVVLPVEGLLFELIRDSQHPAFKQISQLIK